MDFNILKTYKKPVIVTGFIIGIISALLEITSFIIGGITRWDDYVFGGLEPFIQGFLVGSIIAIICTFVYYSSFIKIKSIRTGVIGVIISICIILFNDFAFLGIIYHLLNLSGYIHDYFYEAFFPLPIIAWLLWLSFGFIAGYFIGKNIKE